MNAVALCIAFFANTISSVPTEVQQLAKEKIQDQFRRQSKDVEIRFDDPSCADRGLYEFSAETLRLSAPQSALWPESREYAIADLLEGRKLSFPLPLHAPSNPFLEQRSVDGYSLSPEGRVALGILLGGIAGAVGGAALSPNEESRFLNGLVFGLSGSLGGGLLTFLW